MQNDSQKIKEYLTALITEMGMQPEAFVKNPQKDFTRKRKLPFEEVVRLLITMGGSSIGKELLKFYEYDIGKIISTSAFIQQRNKILLSAFEYLLSQFTQKFCGKILHNGYRLLAIDGSEMQIAFDPYDEDTYVRNSEEHRGCNLVHLDALYDLKNKLYLGALLKPYRKKNENLALVSLVNQSTVGGKVILTADRGYESYNNFAHIEQKGWNYVIRVKDGGTYGILAGLPLPKQPEFDFTITRLLTRKQTNEVKAHPQLYRRIPLKVKFDFLDLHTRLFYPMTFRIVRFKLPTGSYETLITNLMQENFSSSELKNIYQLRWGIETSFRELKYAVGLLNFHSKKLEHIAQEVFARLIMYNFAEVITSNVVIQQRKTAQYVYQVNFTIAIHICMQFLRSFNNVHPPAVETLIAKFILPIRPGRSDPRKMQTRSAVSFLYRIA